MKCFYHSADLDGHCFRYSHLLNDYGAEDLGLAPLGDYGGATLTHALLPGSPALDMADPEHCEATDQRGVQRPVGANCDIGAVEGVLQAAILIPALNPWGLAVFVLALGGAGASCLRRMLKGKGKDFK